MNIKKFLEEKIETTYYELIDLERDSKEYVAKEERLNMLVDRAIELEKIDKENDVKLQQLDDNRKDRKFQNSIAIAGIVIPALITIWGTCKSLKFEEEGTFTTLIGRGFINKLLPKK